MSEKLWERKGLLVTSFHGGETRGQMLQFTASYSVQANGYLQLEADDVESLLNELRTWLFNVRKGKQP